MSLILSGSDGLSDVDGSAATPAIRGTDSNTGIFFPAADTIAFAEGGTEVMRIDSSGNVGVGVTPSAWGSGFKALQLGLAGNFGAQTGARTLELACNAYNNSGWKYQATDKATLYYQYDGGHYWSSAASGTAGNAITFTDAMTLDASGNLLVGTTSGISYATRLTLSTDSGTNKWAVGPYATSSAFIIAANTSFGVYLPTTSATSWSSASDERLKENLVEITGAVSKIASLRAVTGNYISDETKTAKPFLIAQDVQSVLPEAVTVMPDGEHLGISYTDVVPLLVAAIKEQQALITSLTARIAALEGAAQ